MSEATETAAHTYGWRAFWNRGGVWRAILLAAAYYALYQLGSLAFSPLAGSVGGPTSASYVLVFYVLPIAWGCIVLGLFAWSMGWLRTLFARQPIGGRGWMWIAIVAVLLFNLLRYAAINYDAAGFEVVATWLLASVFIGIAEETLTRGFVVNLMRKAGHREIIVAVTSAAIFAALHAGNLLSGQPLLATGIQLLYTFAFGLCMYVALRLSGTLLAPILLHASTDASIFLLGEYPTGGALFAIANLGNFAVILVGFVSLFFIRGRVGAGGAFAAGAGAGANGAGSVDAGSVDAALRTHNGGDLQK